jgi:hypothetical protein
LNYNDLCSIVSSSKTPFPVETATDSFRLAKKGGRPYIKPTLTKDVFEVEQPRFLLVSAVGAAGKSALADQLSQDSGLPVLNLGKHPPVADNTLTGILTTSFAFANLAGILGGLRSGSYGVIIDGIDEGRSKVNEPAFNAFLDDLIKLSTGSQKTAFVLLGRTQALFDSWFYLLDRGVSTGLASIDPFSRENAVEYIDTFADPPSGGQRAQYESARDLILAKLEGAFSGQAANYLSFIGYPPVLDAIATLLHEEKNYYKFSEDIQKSGHNEVETTLLYKISAYLLDREKLDKVIPNVVDALIREFPTHVQEGIRYRAYDLREQAARLLAYCQTRPYSLEVIPQAGLNLQYEDQVGTFLADHPFLLGGSREFRNAVFEAVCLAVVIAGGTAEELGLVRSYTANRRSNLYLIQMLDQVAARVVVPSALIDVIIGAALEYRSTGSRAEVTIEPTGIVRAKDASSQSPVEVEVLIEIVPLNSEAGEHRFVFTSTLSDAAPLSLGSRLSACFVEVPGDLVLSGGEEIELVAPVELSARCIEIRGARLVVKAQPKIADNQVDLEAREVLSSVTSAAIDPGAEFSIRVEQPSMQQFPLVKYTSSREVVLPAEGVREKYLKLRKILTHFRSHSRGTLAKLKAKVENERVGGNETGRPVLDRLVADRILVAQGLFFFLDPPKVHEHLGVTWTELREGKTNRNLVEYLESIR